tara:strand:- start:442 stop:591 length:150 start_codon:yes stop_codon:yes gene_type:complete
MSIQTPLTQMFNIQHPIILAGTVAELVPIENLLKLMMFSCSTYFDVEGV